MRERILANAKEDARRTLETAQAECRRTAEEYAARAQALREEIVARAEREGEREIARARSGAAMTQRNLLLQTRAALLDEAFANARRQLLEDSGGKYRELLTAWLVGALVSVAEAEEESAALGDELAPYEHIEVLFNEKDRARYGESVVAAACRTAGRRIGDRAAKVCLSEETAPIDGGLLVRCGDVEINCSLSMLLTQLRADLEPKVAAVLFG